MKPNRTIAWLLMVTLLAGCATEAPSVQATRGFNGQAPTLKKIGVIVDAPVSYYTGGFKPSAAERAEETAARRQGVANVQAEVNRALREKGYTVVMLPMDDDAHAVLKEFDAARGNNMRKPFPATQGKIATVAALPAAAALAARAGVDGIVIINGKDSKASTRGAIVQVVAMVVLVAALAVMVAGTGDGGPLPTGPSTLPYDADFAFIDRTGKILFYERSNMAVLNRESVQRANRHFSNDLAAPRH